MSLTLKKCQQGGYIPVSQCGTLEITFIKTSGTVGRDRGKNWQIADCCVPNYNPRNKLLLGTV